MSELTTERVKEIRASRINLVWHDKADDNGIIVQLCDALLAEREQLRLLHAAKDGDDSTVSQMFEEVKKQSERAEKAEAEAAAMRKTLEELQRYISYGEYPHLYDLLDATLEKLK